MTLKKILIIFNPKAGRHYPRNFKELFLARCAGHLPQASFVWLETSADFKNQLAGISLPEYQRMIIIGGDGTIRQAAEHLLQNNLDIPLAIIPAGSHNVLASSLSLSKNFKKAIKVACFSQPKKIDICLLNGKFIFLICLSLGYWSEVINRTEVHLKNRFGLLAYWFTLFKHREIRNMIFDFTIDGQLFKIPGNAMLIANALSVFGISPRLLVDFTDGQLEIFINQNKSFLGLLRVAFSFVFSKKSTAGMFKARGRKIIINLLPNQKIAAQIDGEPIELDNTITAEIISGKQISIVSI